MHNSRKGRYPSNVYYTNPGKVSPAFSDFGKAEVAYWAGRCYLSYRTAKAPYPIHIVNIDSGNMIRRLEIKNMKVIIEKTGHVIERQHSK